MTTSSSKTICRPLIKTASSKACFNYQTRDRTVLIFTRLLIPNPRDLQTWAWLKAVSPWMALRTLAAPQTRSRFNSSNYQETPQKGQVPPAAHLPLSEAPPAVWEIHWDLLEPRQRMQLWSILLTLTSTPVMKIELIQKVKSSIEGTAHIVKSKEHRTSQYLLPRWSS